MAEINGKDPSPTEEQAQEEVSASRKTFRQELNKKLEALFEAIGFDDDHPSALAPKSDSNYKGFNVLNVDRQTFVDNGVSKDICNALFDFYNGGPPDRVAQSHGDFLIIISRYNTGILLTIENLHGDDSAVQFALSEDNRLSLASTVEGNKPFIIAEPYQPSRGILPNVPPYKPVNLDREREDCFAVIETITVLARQTGFIKG